MAAGDELIGGARQRQRIDAGMRSEALIFKGKQQVEIGRIDVLLRVDRQPPAAVGHGVGAEQLSVAIDDGGRDLPRLRQRQRPERGHPGCEDAGETEGDQAKNGNDTGAAAFPTLVMPGLDPGIHDFVLHK